MTSDEMTTDELNALMHGSMPFTAVLGVTPIAASKDQVRARLGWSETLCTSDGVMHGGVLMSLADSTGGLCAFLNLPPDTFTTTVESKTNLLRGVREGYVEAVSTPLHTGRTIIVIETEIRNDTGKLVAKTTQTQAVIAAAAS